MTLAGRSARRTGAGLRWVAVGVVITLIVLLADASLKSRSPGPAQQLAAGTWVDRVLPMITSTNQEGQVLASVWANGLKMPAPSLAAEVNQLAAGAASNYAAVEKLRPPQTLGGAPGLLEAALLARSKAAANVKAAFDATLGSAVVAPGTTSTSTAAAAPWPPTAVLTAVTSAGSEMQVGDQAYQLFQSSLPSSLGVRFPPSAWATDMGPYATATAQVYLTTLQSTRVTTPVHQVRVYALSTTPAPVSRSAAVQVIPDAAALTVDVVLADTGNQPESNLTVTAAISPVGHGTSSVRDFVNLAVGQAYTITALGPLDPPQGVPVTLTVTVTPPAGSTTPPTSSALVFQMPAPPSPTTTTATPPTTPPTSGTARAGAGG